MFGLIPDSHTIHVGTKRAKILIQPLEQLKLWDIQLLLSQVVVEVKKNWYEDIFLDPAESYR